MTSDTVEKVDPSKAKNRRELAWKVEEPKKNRGKKILQEIFISR